MKIRIKGNSIRFRLSQTDVKKFEKEGYLEEVTDFGVHTFTYAVNRVNDNNNLYADFNDGLLVMHVPYDLAKEWTSTDKISLEHNQDIDGYGRYLLLLLEKDFKCIGKERNEDQSDNFDNPNSSCK